jgi:hypothetical protein
VAPLVDRVRRELVLARFIGKLAVDHGLGELRRTVVASLRPVADAEASPTPVTAPAAKVPPAAPAPPAEPVAATTGDPVELALPDYEQLPAAHIVSMLDRLSPAERDAIEQFELTHRRRRTVLGRLDQLREDAT